MARVIREEVQLAVKDLITQISGFEEGSSAFNHIQKHILSTLKKSDTMYFLNRREVDESIAGMGEKFIFHGFMPQAKVLQDSYKAYVTNNLAKSELMTRLNIVKFLLCMSERPTSNFLENPEEFVTEEVEEEEEINWTEYLNDGIERWSPNFEDTSESSGESSIEEDAKDAVDRPGRTPRMPVVIDGSDKETLVDLRTNREELVATIQHSWYHQDRFFMAPFSQWREANIGILWDNYLEDQVRGLVPIERSSVLSEYKVIREILWQLWNLHTSAVFELDGDKLKPKTNITISSVRSEEFEKFLFEFTPYMEILDYFRMFSKSLEIQEEECIFTIPQTFRSYNDSLQNIIRPVYRRLSEIEDMVKEQEATYTLLKLADELQRLFEPILLLQKIHSEVVIDFHQNSLLRCTTLLLCKLHDSLQYSASKLEQDLRMTLFVESLYYYFTLIDCWLMKNDLSDYSGEFLIINKNKSLYASGCFNPDDSVSISEADNWKLNFDLHGELDDFCAKNSIVKIICEKVLQVGRNIHLLRILGKFSLINDSKDTIYHEFVEKFLKVLCKFFDKNPEGFLDDETAREDDIDRVNGKKFKYPVVCTDKCVKPTDMDKLENLVDTSDGFLMLAFQDYFTEKPEVVERKVVTLFEKVSRITTTMFPTSNFFERILSGIIKDRFTVSGLMVKNILIEEHLLEKQFQFLRHTFLFFDDMIFPFYRKLFEKTKSFSRNWGNDVWLTAHLQDIIMDSYPEFYESCTVEVRDNWQQCVDSLDACKMVNLKYDIPWPLNIIICGPQMSLYKDMFQFILGIKWALYTVNHLVFTDLEPKKLNKKQPKTHRLTIMKLKYLKFSLNNLLNSIQHYIFSFAFTKCLQKFELDFEMANDLASIMASHSDFINTIYAMTMDVRRSGDNQAALENVITSVKQLKGMWRNVDYATPDSLWDCYQVYMSSFNAIDPIVCPVYIFDY